MYMLLRETHTKVNALDGLTIQNNVHAHKSRHIFQKIKTIYFETLLKLLNSQYIGLHNIIDSFIMQ